MICNHCLGDHEPDTDDVFVEARGVRFTRPFRCICCGVEICGEQFAWGRMCGVCDSGTCEYKPLSGQRALFPHAPPAWRTFEEFVLTVNGTLSSVEDD